MIAPRRGWVLDESHSSDDILVLLTRAGSLLARNELLTRNRERMSACIAHLSGQFRLTREDREDLEQQVVFWTLEAVTAFDAQELAKPNGCSFGSFLEKVVNRRVANFARAKRRHGKHFPAGVDEGADGKMGGGGEECAMRRLAGALLPRRATPLKLPQKRNYASDWQTRSRA